jgi:hypothetical protein
MVLSWFSVRFIFHMAPLSYSIESQEHGLFQKTFAYLLSRVQHAHTFLMCASDQLLPVYRYFVDFLYFCIKIEKVNKVALFTAHHSKVPD